MYPEGQPINLLRREINSMPIHDWSGVDHGIFHDFHQAWTIEIRNALNGGILPAGYFALAEQVVSGPILDVVTLQRQPHAGLPGSGGGLALADAPPPQARFVTSVEADVPYIYVPAPLESTYQTTWQECPAVVREMVAARE